MLDNRAPPLTLMMLHFTRIARSADVVVASSRGPAPDQLRAGGDSERATVPYGARAYLNSPAHG